MLDTLSGDIDRHLKLAGDVLAQMQPARRAVITKDHRSLGAKDKK